MPLSYHWNTNSLQVVCGGSIHMLANDDARYPWVLAALARSEADVRDALEGCAPAWLDETQLGQQWSIEAFEQDDTDGAWNAVDVVDDGWQACTQACQHLLMYKDASCVRVLNDCGQEVYSLRRNVMLPRV